MPQSRFSRSPNSSGPPFVFLLILLLLHLASFPSLSLPLSHSLTASPPSETSFAVERVLSDVIFSPIAQQSQRSAAAGSSPPSVFSYDAAAAAPSTRVLPGSLSCFYDNITGPAGNRLQAVIATGKSINDLGNYDMCLNATGTQFCSVGVVYDNNTVTPFSIGVCVSSNCSSDQVLDATSKVFDQVADLFPGIELGDYTVHCVTSKPSFSPFFYVTLSLYGFLIAMCIAGTWLKWPKPKPVAPKLLREAAISADLAEPMLDVAKAESKQEPEKPRSPSCCVKIVMTFDVRTNFRKLTQPSVDPRLASLNGIRSFSMLWIIYAHTFINAFVVSFQNGEYMLPPNGATGKWGFMMVPGGYFAVDAFFWLGGFLVVFHLLNEIRKKGRGPPTWILYIFRIFRILPTYIYYLLFFVGVLEYLGDGPLWYHVTEHTKPCLTYWWTNLLFINNFYPTTESDSCMDWSWYLANDMQFFLITPFLIWIYHKSRAAGVTVAVALLAASTALRCWLIIGGTTMPGGYVLPKDLSSQGGSPTNKYFISEIYTKPYTRIQAYLLGILAGYFDDIYKIRRSEPKRLPMWLDLLLSGLGIALCAIVVLGEKKQYDAVLPPWSLAQNVAYNGFSKISFTLGLSILLMLMISGNARFINWILTWQIWNPMARLTFGAYLVHPMIMDMVYDSSRTIFYWDYMFLPVHFFFFVVLGYLLSAVQFLMLERPLMSVTGLMKGLLSGKGKRGTRTPASSTATAATAADLERPGAKK